MPLWPGGSYLMALSVARSSLGRVRRLKAVYRLADKRSRGVVAQFSMIIAELSQLCEVSIRGAANLRAVDSLSDFPTPQSFDPLTHHGVSEAGRTIRERGRALSHRMQALEPRARVTKGAYLPLGLEEGQEPPRICHSGCFSGCLMILDVSGSITQCPSGLVAAVLAPGDAPGLGVSWGEPVGVGDGVGQF